MSLSVGIGSTSFYITPVLQSIRRHVGLAQTHWGLWGFNVLRRSLRIIIPVLSYHLMASAMILPTVSDAWTRWASARWVYPAVVWCRRCRSSLPTRGRFSPDMAARLAAVCRRSCSCTVPTFISARLLAHARGKRRRWVVRPGNSATPSQNPIAAYSFHQSSRYNDISAINNLSFRETDATI